MLLDGRALAHEIEIKLKTQVAEFPRRLRLAIVMAGEHPAISAFVKKKQEFGTKIGCDVRVHAYPADISAREFRLRVAGIVHEKKNTGVILQLPLPAHVSMDAMVNAIPPKKDVDVLSSRAVGDFIAGRSLVTPPVVAAIQEMFRSAGISLSGKRIVIVGRGRLVGRPVACWLLREPVRLAVLGSDTADIASYTKDADVVIVGVGKARLITGDMVKPGAVVIDAGSSEDVVSGGKIVGDVDRESVEKVAGYFAPVPGGVGPLTVAMLFQNLLTLAKHQR